MAGLTTGSFIIGAFNALAFTGTSLLFRSLDNSGYQKEVKRHNRAMEELAAAKEKWYENQVKQKEKMQKLQRDMAAAGADIRATNLALMNLQKITHNGMVFRREPKEANFYRPSKEMRDLQHVVSGAVGIGVGIAGASVFL